VAGECERMGKKSFATQGGDELVAARLIDGDGAGEPLVLQERPHFARPVGRRRLKLRERPAARQKPAFCRHATKVFPSPLYVASA
jgi:hypothetical protein